VFRPCQITDKFHCWCMTHQTTVQRVGNSLGITLPDEVLRSLGVSENDVLSLTISSNGGVVLSAEVEYTTEKMMTIARDVMHRYSGALKKLAE
jgi:putative addiction module antidote